MLDAAQMFAVLRYVDRYYSCNTPALLISTISTVSTVSTPCYATSHHSTHPDVERQVGAVEQHDVAGESMLAVLPRHAPPAHLLVSPALDFSATEKPEHVGPAWWRPARRR